jgi:plasmid stabilization system protein ParE
MKRYAVVFEESAQSDVRESYDWGRRKREAQQWVRQLRKAVTEQLAVVPKAFSLAPEDDEFSVEISADDSRSISHPVYDQGPQGPCTPY